MRIATMVAATLTFAACTPTGGGTDAGGGEGEGEGEGDPGFGEIFRTLVYRELTAEATRVHERSLAVSSDGYYVSFTTKVDNQIRVWLAPTDGTSPPLQIDAYDELCACDGTTVMTAAADLIASTDGVQIRIVDQFGTFVRSLELTEGWISDMTFSDNGVLFFSLYRDDGYEAGPLERGIWKLAPLAPDPEQLVGPVQAAAAASTTVDLVQFFSLAGPTLDADALGARLVFGVPVSGVGDHLFAYTVASDSMQLLVGPVGAAQTAGPGIRHGSLSSDGTLVAYEAGNTPGAVDPSEWSVVGFDGANRRVITQTPPSPSVTNFSFAPLSGDGSRLLLGDVGDLYETDDGEVVQLSFRGGFFSSDPLFISEGAIFHMAGTGNHFAFTRADALNIAQLASLHVDQPNVLDAPDLANPRITKQTLKRDGVDAATVRVFVSGDGIVRVATTMLRDGRRDTAENCLAAEVVLLDDGMGADTAAGDGTYTSAPITATACTPLDEWVVRVKAESVIGGKRRATAVDFVTLTVTD